eukprot:scaffold109440_cov13-Tisochrysis_lutea.AAC.1
MGPPIATSLQVQELLPQRQPPEEGPQDLRSAGAWALLQTRDLAPGAHLRHHCGAVTAETKEPG